MKKRRSRRKVIGCGAGQSPVSSLDNIDVDDLSQLFVEHSNQGVLDRDGFALLHGQDAEQRLGREKY